MNENSYSLGIDIGGTNTVFGLVSNNGLVVKKKSIKTESDKGPIHLFDNLFNQVEAWNSEPDKTYVLKNKNEPAGYFELILHTDKNEVEIAYLGLLEEYQNKKLGSYLLSAAIKNSFKEKPNRVWVHTCSLDHKNALNNYIARGMKVFKTETVVI